MLERLQLVTLVPRVVLDAGAGTGHASRALKRRYPKALVVALDSSQQDAAGGQASSSPGCGRSSASAPMPVFCP